MAITEGYTASWSWTQLEDMLKLVQGDVGSNFTDQDATPSVSGGSFFSTANTQATTITDFDDGVAGQVIFVVLDANTTLDFTANANMKGNVGVDFAAAAGDAVIAFTPNGTVWYCAVIDGTA